MAIFLQSKITQTFGIGFSFVMPIKGVLKVDTCVDIAAFLFKICKYKVMY